MRLKDELTTVRAVIDELSRQVPRWVPVNEEVHESGDWHLVLSSDGRVGIGNNCYEGGEHWDVIWLDSRERARAATDVTHYLDNLPPLPGEEES